MRPLGTLLTARTTYEQAFEVDRVPEIQTFVLLHFERADVVVRVLRETTGETLFDAQAAPEAVDLPLAADESGTLTSWNFRIGNGMRFVPVRLTDETVLELPGCQGFVKAVRANPPTGVDDQASVDDRPDLPRLCPSATPIKRKS